MASSKLWTVLIDLSGTLHIENTVIPGAIEALKRLRLMNVNIKFVTNTTKESGRVLYERLKFLGFHIERNEIFTSLTAARKVVEEKHLRPMLFLETEAMEDFDGIPLNNPNAVVIGLAPSQFHYDRLNEAFRLLQNGAELIGIHKSRYFKRTDGMVLGPGPFIAALEYATDVKATIVGKPEAAFFLEALKEFHAKPENSIMIGDDARDDVAGAQSAGLKGILVATGKYRQNDENQINPKPWATCANFPSAVEFLSSALLQ